MITLNVARDKKGRVVLLNKQPPAGVRLVFRKVKPMDSITKRLKKMWLEFNEKQDNARHGEDYRWQQKMIRKMAKKHFGVNLSWDNGVKDKDDDCYGWPTKGFWRANKMWFNKEIRRLS